MKETKQVGLRLKEALRQRLLEAAASNGNSLNAEITKRIELSFLHEEAAGQDQRFAAEMKEILRQQEILFAQINERLAELAKAAE